MTEAPRTIWANAQEWPKGTGRIEVYASSRPDPDEPSHLYHHDAVVRELREALEECRDALDAYSRQEYPLDHPVHERYRKRDYDSNPARIALAKLDGGE